MSPSNYTDHFLTFAASLEMLLAGHNVDKGKDFTARQKEQVEALILAEKEFKKVLLADSRGPGTYRAFIRFILDDRRNILDARPYFRERQEIFKKQISPILRARENKSLYKFCTNYPFIAFVLKAGKFAPGSRVAKAADKVKAVRTKLIEANMPLAISRARIFKKNTRAAHLEHMDLVQIANEGLIAAVDKFVLPYTPVFRSVIIGRIVGNIIEEVSDTVLHFYPSDKRKIYRANKATRDPDSVDWDKVVESINIDADPKHFTNVDEVKQLMLASRHVSMESKVNNDEVKKVYDNYEADEGTRPDVRVEKQEIRQALLKGVSQLEKREKKIIAMKNGVIT